MTQQGDRRSTCSGNVLSSVRQQLQSRIEIALGHLRQ
jgi:hypothetical protein